VDSGMFKIGEKVIWLHYPRGGYGYCCPITATIAGLTNKKVKIEVMKKSGEKVFRYVLLDNLKKTIE
jgi:hypothetical protein